MTHLIVQYSVVLSVVFDCDVLTCQCQLMTHLIVQYSVVLSLDSAYFKTMATNYPEKWSILQKKLHGNCHPDDK